MKRLFRVLLVVSFVVAMMSVMLTSVSAQGGVWGSGFTIQNQDTVNAANVTIKFYWAEGTPNAGDEVVAARINYSIPAGKSQFWFTPNVPNLPDGFIGSVVVESDRPVAAIINTELPAATGATSNPLRRGTASGVLEAQTGLTMYVPQATNAYYGWNSYIAVQNTTGDTASVTMYYYDTAGAEIVPARNTQSLHPYSTYVFRQEGATGLPGGFGGSAKVVSNKNVAVICNTYNSGVTDYTKSQFRSYNGLAAPAGPTTLYAPRVVKGYYNYDSGLKVQNVGGGPTTVTVQYKFGATTYTQTSPSINPGQAWGPFMGTPSQVPELAGVTGSGSAIISAGQPIIANINEGSDADGKGYTYNAFLASEATSSVLFPDVASKYYGYCTGIQIQNVSDSAGTLSVVYSMPSRPDIVLSSIPIAARSSWLMFTPNVGGMGADFKGAVVATCSGCNIVGVADTSYRFDVDPRYGAKYGDSATIYNGINK